MFAGSCPGYCAFHVEVARHPYTSDTLERSACYCCVVVRLRVVIAERTRPQVPRCWRAGAHTRVWHSIRTGQDRSALHNNISRETIRQRSEQVNTPGSKGVIVQHQALHTLATRVVSALREHARACALREQRSYAYHCTAHQLRPCSTEFLGWGQPSS